VGESRAFAQNRPARGLRAAEPSTSLVGSHIPVAGGLVKVGLREAVGIGAEVIQVFTGNPRGWAPSRADPGTMTAFRDQCGERGVKVFVHAPHLVNLGSPSAETRERSERTLAHTMERAAALGADGVVVHAGSSVVRGQRDVSLARLHDVLGRLLDTAPPGVRLLVEPTAGGGEALASTIESAIEYLDAVNDERVEICLDTCHLHAAGENVTDPAGLLGTITALTDAIGNQRLGLIHVNDSSDSRGSHRDRHETLGRGSIGRPALGALFTTPTLRGVPMLSETPTHLEDVTTLKELRAAGQFP
jgi:deoxyribonuclease IV